MYLGLDIGGTHTDAVIVSGNEVLASYKTVTDHNNLARSVISVLEKITSGLNKDNIRQINLSTTLSTNAIVENKLSRVGVIVSAGPGINPENYSTGKNYHIINGVIDHRGEEINPLDIKSLDASIKKLKGKKIKYFAAVTKFSTRNPDHENLISQKLIPFSLFTTCGHALSGRLNFPRRINTAYYNSAVFEIYNNFSEAIKKGLKKIGLTENVNVLKADGGTMPFNISAKIPVESIMSGPAASIMGILALTDIKEDAIVLDIGGTTTDIAVFSKGFPLFERNGININGLPTLVKSLMSRSIGIGGDSMLDLSQGDVQIGNKGRVKSFADGGKYPALIDLLNFKEYAHYGDTNKSNKGIKKVSAQSGIDADELCNKGIESAVGKIVKEANMLVDEINSKPVYTIHDMVDGEEISPQKIYIMGGPAEVL